MNFVPRDLDLHFQGQTFSCHAFAIQYYEGNGCTWQICFDLYDLLLVLILSGLLPSEHKLRTYIFPMERLYQLCCISTVWDWIKTVFVTSLQHLFHPTHCLFHSVSFSSASKHTYSLFHTLLKFTTFLTHLRRSTGQLRTARNTSEHPRIYQHHWFYGAI